MTGDLDARWQVVLAGPDHRHAAVLTELFDAAITGSTLQPHLDAVSNNREAGIRAMFHQFADFTGKSCRRPRETAQ